MEKLIAEINAGGFLVSDIYQSSPDHWHAALRATGDWTTRHGQGSTALAALEAAWAVARGRKRMYDKDWAALSDRPPPGNIPRRRLSERSR